MAHHSLSLPQVPSILPAHFSPDREIHVVISTQSGQLNAQRYYDSHVVPFLASLKLKQEPAYFTHKTTSADSIISLTEKTFLFNSRKGVKQTIILLSGDGGLVDIVNTLTTILMRDIDDTRPPSIFFKPVICLIPEGTANAMAWSYGIAADPLGVMLRGRPKPLPEFEVRSSMGARLVSDEGRGRSEIDSCDTQGFPRMYGVVVFSWGLHASLVAMSDTTEYRKHGLERFKMAAQELMKEAHRYQGKVKIRTERYGEWADLHPKAQSTTDEHSYVLATMVSNLEQNFRISPASTPLANTMRLIAIGAQSPEAVMRVLTLAYQDGKHVDDAMDIVTYQEIDGLRIEFSEQEERWRQVCVDGKIVAVEPGGWVEVKLLPAVGVDGRRVVDLVC